MHTLLLKYGERDGRGEHVWSEEVVSVGSAGAALGSSFPSLLLLEGTFS